MYDFVKNIVGLFAAKSIERAATNQTKGDYSIKPKRQRISRVDLSMDNFTRACELARDPIYPRRLDLFYIYESIVKDPHLIAQITTRTNELQREPYTLIDAKGNELADLLPLIETPWFYSLLEAFVHTPLWGHRLLQFQPLRRDPEKPKAAPEFWAFDIIPWGFVLPEKGVVLMNESDRQGIPYREGALAKYGRLLEMGKRDHLGLLESAAPEVIWKRFSRGDWSRQGEKLGIPWVFVHTPETSQKKLDEYYDMLASAGSDLNGVVGVEDRITAIQNTVANAHLTFWDNCKMSNEEISKLIVGQTSTSDQKSFAGSANVHERVLESYANADLRAFYYWANWELFPFLRYHGYPIPSDAKFVWRLQIQQTEASAQTQETKKASRFAEIYKGLPTKRLIQPTNF